MEWNYCSDEDLFILLCFATFMSIIWLSKNYLRCRKTDWKLIGYVKHIYVYPIEGGYRKEVNQVDYSKYGLSASGYYKNIAWKDRKYLIYLDEREELEKHIKQEESRRLKVRENEILEKAEKLAKIKKLEDYNKLKESKNPQESKELEECKKPKEGEKLARDENLTEDNQLEKFKNLEDTDDVEENKELGDARKRKEDVNLEEEKKLEEGDKSEEDDKPEQVDKPEEDDILQEVNKQQEVDKPEEDAKLAKDDIPKPIILHEASFVTLKTDNLKYIPKGKVRRVKYPDGTLTSIRDCGYQIARVLNNFTTGEDNTFRLGHHNRHARLSLFQNYRFNQHVENNILNYSGLNPEFSMCSLVNDESVKDIKCKSGQDELMPSSFRPNFVIEQAEKYCEDKVEYLEIGPVKFSNVLPCTIGEYVNIDPESGTSSKEGQPYSTLLETRKLKDVRPDISTTSDIPVFGITLAGFSKGTINVGDKVYAKFLNRP